MSLTPINYAGIGSFIYAESRNVCRLDAVCSTRVLIGSHTPGDTDMSEDIIVLGGLAAVFCRTYIVLPLLYDLNWVT
jgi:hypothetical protein